MPAPTVGGVFDAASEGFTVWTRLLWDPIGAATVATVAPAPGNRVLDACCGNGASALPAAEAVGPDGLVHGVDLSAALLALGRERATAAGLSNVEFHAADVATWQPPDGQPYDVVQCVFGVFFLPDMDSGGKHLLSLLRPGGRIAITSWQRGSVEPLIIPYAQAAAAEHAAAGTPSPEPSATRAASARIDDADDLAGWLSGIGAVDVAVRTISLEIPVTDELAWDFVTGSGARVMLHGLSAEAVARVRGKYLEALHRDSIEVFRATALIGHGRLGDR